MFAIRGVREARERRLQRCPEQLPPIGIEEVDSDGSIRGLLSSHRDVMIRRDRRCSDVIVQPMGPVQLSVTGQHRQLPVFTGNGEHGEVRGNREADHCATKMPTPEFAVGRFKKQRGRMRNAAQAHDTVSRGSLLFCRGVEINVEVGHGISLSNHLVCSVLIEELADTWRGSFENAVVVGRERGGVEGLPTEWPPLVPQLCTFFCVQ
ncbi:hypothetical protein ALP29_201794 [Pseudomonas syringae pv. avii]|uniref:Uncharacterized protein n=1 Tax=Pseudomonas syringae pv. avii TaxID=663959 RepID=A0A3M5V1A9_PSESX|nr:hypothetical protein ALP29_201794 [Pseudomonas syringae pv. avii]